MASRGSLIWSGGAVASQGGTVEGPPAVVSARLTCCSGGLGWVISVSGAEGMQEREHVGGNSGGGLRLVKLGGRVGPLRWTS